METKLINIQPPTIGRIVIYRTDGRNGLSYDLPAMVNCTKATHPGDYVRHDEDCQSLCDGNDDSYCTCEPTTEHNPLPVPETPFHVHLTVFTPGGVGTKVIPADDRLRIEEPRSSDFVGAASFVPGSGTYVELGVPIFDANGGGEIKRTWRWPERA